MTARNLETRRAELQKLLEVKSSSVDSTFEKYQAKNILLINIMEITLLRSV